MANEPLPVLRCECRRLPAIERGLLLWSLALVLVGAAALDAFWAVPQAQRATQRAQLELVRCREIRAAPPARELRVDDVKLLTPTQAAR